MLVLNTYNHVLCLVFAALSHPKQACHVFVVLQHISFTLQSNSTTNWFKGHYQNPNTYFQLPLQMAAERETARHLANGELTTCSTH